MAKRTPCLVSTLVESSLQNGWLLAWLAPAGSNFLICDPEISFSNRPVCYFRGWFFAKARKLSAASATWSTISAHALAYQARVIHRTLLTKNHQKPCVLCRLDCAPTSRGATTLEIIAGHWRRLSPSIPAGYLAAAAPCRGDSTTPSCTTTAVSFGSTLR